MSYSPQNRLVIGLASSALLDLSESDSVSLQEGEEAYRQYQELHLEDRLNPGETFPFVQRLLSLNDLSVQDDLRRAQASTHPQARVASCGDREVRVRRRSKRIVRDPARDIAVGREHFGSERPHGSSADIATRTGPEARPRRS